MAIKRILSCVFCAVIIMLFAACERAPADTPLPESPDVSISPDLPESPVIPSETPATPTPKISKPSNGKPTPTQEPSPAPTQEPENPSPTMTKLPTPKPTPRNIIYYNSITEARKVFKHDFKYPKQLPEDFSRKSIGIVDWNMVEIVYEKDGETLVYRVKYGSSNISGDYTAYESVVITDINNIQTVIKSTAGLTYLALWETDGYSYSLRAAKGLPEDVIKNIVASAS